MRRILILETQDAILLEASNTFSCIIVVVSLLFILNIIFRFGTSCSERLTRHEKHLAIRTSKIRNFKECEYWSGGMKIVALGNSALVRTTGIAIR